MELRQKVIWALGELSRGNSGVAEELSTAHLQWQGFVTTIAALTLDSSQPTEIRVAACIVVKDLIPKHLNQLSTEDRVVLRQWAVEAPTSVHSNKSMSKLVKETVFQLVSYEYPNKWPDLAETVFRRLTSALNLDQIQGVLLLLEAVVETLLTNRDTGSTASWKRKDYHSISC